MKNTFLIALLVWSWCLVSCNNDLDLAAPDEPFPVVFFRMDPADSLFTLTLTRSFSGNGSAFDLAKDSRKVFYGSADIRLENWQKGYKIDEARFIPANLTKKPGIFPEVPGYCFQAFNELSLINPQDIGGMASDLRLVIDIGGKFGPITSTIPMMPLPAQSKPSKWEKKFDLYPPDSSDFRVEFLIDHEYVKYCELICTFRYQELAGSYVDRSVTFSLRKDMMIIEVNREFYAISDIYPDQFFNKLTTNIKPLNDTIIRKFQSMDLIFIAGDGNYKDYNDTYINAGNTDGQPLGNINNGIGLFTMIRTVRMENLIMSIRTLDSLANGQYTRRLGFNIW